MPCPSSPYAVSGAPVFLLCVEHAVEERGRRHLQELQHVLGINEISVSTGECARRLGFRDELGCVLRLHCEAGTSDSSGGPLNTDATNPRRPSMPPRDDAIELPRGHRTCLASAVIVDAAMTHHRREYHTPGGTAHNGYARIAPLTAADLSIR